MQLKNKLSLLLTGLLFLTFSQLSLAAKRVEKLAEYDFLEHFLEFVTSEDTIFKGQAIQIKMERDSAHKPILSTKKLINNYKDVEVNKFSLDGLVNPDAEYDLDVSTSNDFMYILLTNSEDSVRDKKNLLLRSADGQNWNLFKSFPAEWELFDLEVDGKNLSVTCVNCEDPLKLSYIISNDEGTSWTKYSLAESNDISYFSGIANDKLFVVAQSRNPDDRKELIHQLQFRSLKNKNSEWLNADISNLMSVSKKQDGQDVVYKFDDVDSLHSSRNYIIATTSYETVPQDENEEVETMQVNWISRDNGETWQLFKFKNLDNEEIVQLSHHDNFYHVVTNKDVDFPDVDDTDQGFDWLGLIMQYFNQQQYTYYKLSEDDMNKTGSFNLEPVHNMEHGVGVNLDYNSNLDGAYVDTMFLHSEDDQLKLEFYRLFE